MFVYNYILVVYLTVLIILEGEWLSRWIALSQVEVIIRKGAGATDAWDIAVHPAGIIPSLVQRIIKSVVITASYAVETVVIVITTMNWVAMDMGKCHATVTC